jgi:poly(A) polymerase
MPLLAMKDLKIAVNPGVFQLLDKIKRLLNAEGILAYLVGGFVRDLLLGRDTVDIDIAVGVDGLETARRVAAALGGKYVLLDAENGVGRVVVPGETCHLDFTTLDGDIKQDLARRDFTVDAIALPLDESFEPAVDTARLIDPFDGRGDLRRHVLKSTGPGVFEADAVRMLRAVRLAAELGLRIEDNTEGLIRRHTHLITTVAGERVREELLRLFALPGIGPRLTYLDELGLLTCLIPELEAARGVSQPRLHVWNVFEHSIKTTAAVEFVLREGSWDYAGADELAPVPWSPVLERHFEQEIGSGSTRKSLLKLAALLHDVAKPETKTTEVSGRTRFLGHPQLGAFNTAAIMTRLRFSNREIQHVALLIKYHLRPTQMSQEGLPTRRAVYRYFRDTGETGIDLLFLSLADHLATRGATLDRQQWREHARLTDGVLNIYFEEKSPPAKRRLIDGHELMGIFSLEPGPRIGRLLEAVREAQAAGEISDKQEAIAYIRRIMTDIDAPGKNRSKE